MEASGFSYHIPLLDPRPGQVKLPVGTVDFGKVILWLEKNVLGTIYRIQLYISYYCI